MGKHRKQLHIIYIIKTICLSNESQSNRLIFNTHAILEGILSKVQVSHDAESGIISVVENLRDKTA